MKKYIGELGVVVTQDTLKEFLEANDFYKSNSIKLDNINLAEKRTRELTFFSHPKFKSYSQEEYEIEICHDYPEDNNRKMNFQVFFSLRGKGEFSKYFLPLMDYSFTFESDMVMGDLHELMIALFDKQIELVKYGNTLARYKPSAQDVRSLTKSILLERLKFPFVTQETEDSIDKKSVQFLSPIPKEISLLNFALFMQKEIYFEEEAPIEYNKIDSDRIQKAGWASLNQKKFLLFMQKTCGILDNFIHKKDL